MKRAIAIADRIALPAMWLVAMLHLLFLASLLAIMEVARHLPNQLAPVLIFSPS